MSGEGGEGGQFKKAIPISEAKQEEEEIRSGLVARSSRNPCMLRTFQMLSSCASTLVPPWCRVITHHQSGLLLGIGVQLPRWQRKGAVVVAAAAVAAVAIAAAVAEPLWPPPPPFAQDLLLLLRQRAPRGVGVEGR